ncbi:MAG TPA: zincin-like metallopeptidase domain-containing protein [Alicycliphilus sp.]|jgi:antirestriction protein ArdC|nr:zincin-like metallopeptidase domain-containing protein [Alicycliphilus sp.]
MSKTDLYQSVTDRIVAALEAGAPPWVCPWVRGPGLAAPANLGSGRPYRGINVLLLNLQAASCGYTLNRWLTYRQALALGAQVRRGEQGTPVVFFKLLEVEGADASAVDPTDRKVVPLLRSFTVFNAAQVDGLPAGLLPEPVAQDWSPVSAADEVLARSGAVIRHGGVQAYYSVAKDLICLPEPARFSCAEDYYRVALHELTHWSGHADRCNRPLLGRQHIEAYAFEELVAEMGSTFLCGHCGLPASLQHASYVQDWLQALRNDRRLIFTAAALAQKASDYLLAPVLQSEAGLALHAEEAL